MYSLAVLLIKYTNNSYARNLFIYYACCDRSYLHPKGRELATAYLSRSLACHSTDTSARTSKGSSSTSTCISAGIVGATSEVDPSLKRGSSVQCVMSISTNNGHEPINTIPLEGLSEGFHAVRDRYVTTDTLDEHVDQHLMQQQWFQELVQNRKKNWIPGSKGGYPDYYGG